jgi:putative membrane protein
LERSPEHQPSKVDVRQQLAADRTLLAWIRTSVALAGLGFVVARFHLLAQATSSASDWHQGRILGVALVVAGLVVMVLGLFQHRQVTDMLAAHGDSLPVSQRTAVVASVFTLLALAGLCVYLASGVR